MGAIHSKHLRPTQVITLLWNDELICQPYLHDLEKTFPRLRRNIAGLEPRGETLPRSGQYLVIYEIAPCRDKVLWARPEQRDGGSSDSSSLDAFVSPARFGGSEALKIVVFTLLGRMKNGQTTSINSVLADAFTGASRGGGSKLDHSRDRLTASEILQRDRLTHGGSGGPAMSDEDLGDRDIGAFLTLLESFVEVSTVLDCLDAGTLPTRTDIEHAYHKYRKYIKHNLSDSPEDCLRFLRLGDILGSTQMVQDFTFPVLSGFEGLFRKFHGHGPTGIGGCSGSMTFAQFGERGWRLSRRLCDFLELEWKEFGKRRRAMGMAILNEVGLSVGVGMGMGMGGGRGQLLPGLEGLDELAGRGGMYDGAEGGEAMFVTLTPQTLNKLLENSPLTVDPATASAAQNGMHQDHLSPGAATSNTPTINVTGINIFTGKQSTHQDHDHMVIQLRVFRTPGKHHLSSLQLNGDRLTPMQSPIPSRRGSPAPSDYFFTPHQEHAFGARGPGTRAHGLGRANTFHGIDEHFPYAGHGKGEFGDMRTFKDGERFRGRRAAGDMGDGFMMDGRGGDNFGFGGMEMGGGNGLDVGLVTARMMEKAVKEEKKREYVMPWARNGGVNGGMVNGTKLIGYSGDGYRG